MAICRNWATLFASKATLAIGGNMSDERKDDYRLMRYTALGAGEGVVAGWITLLIFKYLDIGRIGTLIEGSDQGALVLAVALGLFGITFGMLGIAWRLMVLLPDEPE